MGDIKFLGTKPNYGWIMFGYDIHYRYGYDDMLRVLDRITEDYGIKLNIVRTAMIAGSAPRTVWKKTIFNKAQPLTQMEPLKEECGEVAIGGICKKLSFTQVYITMANQTSIVVIQVPESRNTEGLKEEIDSLAEAIQSKLINP